MLFTMVDYTEQINVINVSALKMEDLGQSSVNVNHRVLIHGMLLPSIL